jgi:hypothetical protein
VQWGLKVEGQQLQMGGLMVKKLVLLRLASTGVLPAARKRGQLKQQHQALRPKQSAGEQQGF